MLYLIFPLVRNVISIIFFISFRFSSLSALYWTQCSLNSNHAKKKMSRVLFVLQRDTKFPSSTGTKIPLFARKELLVFLTSIWPKSAKHQMPSVLSAIQVALIYLTAMNFDLAELRWCLSEAGRNLTEVPGPGVVQWCEVRNRSQVTTAVSDLCKSALSPMKPNKMR